MTIFKHKNAQIYYEDTGSGDPIITIHGLIENTTYWSSTGITGKLAEKYRIVSMDMRGHGRTIVNGKPEGFDVETIADDIEKLADYLEIEKFHLLTHSTGGFAASRWAMNNSNRLLSLILTNTSSATSPIEGPEEQRNKFYDKFAAGFEKNDWGKIIEYLKINPFPFFRGIAEADNNQKMWDMVLDIVKLGNRETIGRFIRSFYKDPDLKVDGLRKITCPVLILLGEKDDLFLKPSKVMAEEILNSKHVVLKNVGHMTAIEATEKLLDEIINFIE